MTSTKRGDDVTMLPFVNAAGKLFPGVFVFSRKKVNDKTVCNVLPTVFDSIHNEKKTRSIVQKKLSFKAIFHCRKFDFFVSLFVCIVVVVGS